MDEETKIGVHSLPKKMGSANKPRRSVETVKDTAQEGEQTNTEKP